MEEGLERPFAPRTDRVVGRQGEMEAIRQALDGPKHRSYILYLIGGGGFGKTRLLEEAVRLATERRVPLHTAGILDLYHSDLRSADGLEAAIARGLDSDNQYFRGYLEKRSRFEEHRRAAVSPEVLEEERGRLREAFLDDYNQLARQHRILLCFDTLELLVYERDAVQEACRIEQEASEARAWLLEVLPRLENSVVLLAGRLPAPLRDELQTCCSGDEHKIFRPFELGGLSLQESLAYFDEMARREPRLMQVPEDVRQRVWEYTDGRPIRLSLAIDLVLHGHDIADLFPLTADESHVQMMKESIDQRLVNELMLLPSPPREMLHFLILARRGLDEELLHQLAPDWSEDQCRENLTRMRRFTFVKPRPGTGLLFLHDEMYELADRYLQPAPEDRRHSYQVMAGYYQEKLGQSQDLEEQRTFKVGCLYYELQLDPRKAFWGSYVRWDEEAVRAYDMELDVRLRGELLRFTKSPYADANALSTLGRDVIEQDAAVRWVRRFLSRGQHKRAIEVARCIRGSALPALRTDDALYCAALDIAEAEAGLYIAPQEPWVSEMIERAISRLEGWSCSSEEDPRQWWQARLLGRAYNNRGFLHRLAGRNRTAVQGYKKAVYLFRQADVPDEMADTLTNMGFVYARWGRFGSAETALLDAIDLRKRLGQEFALALSYNTLGLTYVYDDVPLRGGEWCQKALDTFERLDQPRGVGLACLALGLARRKQADQWKVGAYSTERADRLFSEAVTFLQGGTLQREDGSVTRVLGAEPVFRSRVDEPMRLWEVYNELGSAYCDWGWLLKQQGRVDEIQQKYEEAVKYLLKSVEIAEQRGFSLQAVDSYEDLAQVYSNWEGHTQDEEEWLHKIEETLPEEYRLMPGGFRDVADPIEEWWVAYGKLHLGYGARKVERALKSVVSPEEKDKLLDDAVEEYCRAVAYFAQYSPDTRRLAFAAQSLHRRLKTLNTKRLERLRAHIVEFSETYNVNMQPLLDPLDDTLGIVPEEA